MDKTGNGYGIIRIQAPRQHLPNSNLQLRHVLLTFLITCVVAYACSRLHGERAGMLVLRFRSVGQSRCGHISAAAVGEAEQ